VAVATRKAVVDAGHDVRRLVFGLSPGVSLHKIILATRQLGADIDAIVDSLLRTVARPPTVDRRQQLRDVVTVVAAARRGGGRGGLPYPASAADRSVRGRGGSSTISRVERWPGKRRRLAP